MPPATGGGGGGTDGGERTPGGDGSGSSSGSTSSGSAGSTPSLALQRSSGSRALEVAVARAAAAAAEQLGEVRLDGGGGDVAAPRMDRRQSLGPGGATVVNGLSDGGGRRGTPDGGAGLGFDSPGGGSPLQDTATSGAWRPHGLLTGRGSGAFEGEGLADDPAGGSPGGGSRRWCPFLIGVAGGTASGKTTVCDRIVQRLHEQCVVMISQDSFYRDLTQEDLARLPDYNFDHPDAFDTPMMLKCLEDLRSGRATDMPHYDFNTHKRTAATRRLEPADVIIVEGILILHIPAIRDLLHMKVYVDTDDDVRLARRIQRDVRDRGRDVAGVIEQYTKFVKPAFDQFVAPSRRYADVIIPWQRGDNLVAIDLITEHIRLKLQQHDLLRIYPNLEVIPSNYQIRGMHTIIRDRNTSMETFTFYADRLNRLVVEAGLGHLPFAEKTVITPCGHRYVGVEFARGICGVSVIRSGESMETALRECCQGIKLGKILVHRHGVGGAQEEVVYERLPADISRRFVLLMDPVLGTGHTACRAVQVLLGRGVAQDRILFLCVIASPEAVHKVCTAFPLIKVITSEIDHSLDNEWRVVPGIGEFGNRYFSD